MSEAAEVVEVVITGPPEFIDQHSRRLVEGRLIACAQVAQVAQVKSTYRWQGQVEQDPEARASLHTLRANIPLIMRLTRSEHPYDVPCILVLPIRDGDPEYLRWVADTVRPNPQSRGDS
jgi:periplasmic divalent cation tolerance protein